MLFIIGNGFDIALGLKTSYRDFLMWYLSSKKVSGDPRIIKFKRAIQSDLEGDVDSWADMEIKLGEYTNEYGEDEAEDFIFAYTDLKEKLNYYIKAQDNKAKSQIDDSSVPEEVRRFIICFYDYFPSNIKMILKNDFNVKHGINLDFINFNYTKTLTNCLGKKGEILTNRRLEGRTYSDYINEIVNVHGEIDNSPLLGIDNETQIKNESFRNNDDIKRLLLKPYINGEMQNGIEEKAKKLINNNNLICFFGVSLGNSDLSWWRNIGAWIMASQARKIVIFWYSSEKSLNVHVHKRLTIEENVRLRFAKQAGITPDEYGALRERIFVCVFNKIFSSKLVGRKRTNHRTRGANP